jgi:hypothetical protein
MGVNAPKFGLYDAKIAVWNSEANYGTAVDVWSVQMMGVTFNTENGQLEGDDIITDVHAKIQSINFSLRFGFKDLDVLEVLTGVTNTESGSNSNTMKFARDNMPYFALCGRADATEGGGDTQVWIPKCKLLEGFSLSLEKGTYMSPEINGIAVYEGSTYGMGWIINNSTAQSVTIPPTVYAG